MIPAKQNRLTAKVLTCWNWKCGLLSATARSLVYLAALARAGVRGSLALVAVEVAYVTFTAGLYAGMQQKALGLRSHLLSGLIIVVGVPGLSQALDWLSHWAVGAAAPLRANAVVWAFSLISALFHLYVMRRGAFLTGTGHRTLVDDLRRMPRLVAGFVVRPLVFALGLAERRARVFQTGAAI
ncbi:MAG: hypothetical protein WCE75_16650 [Terracidiphilus sp.]